MLRHVGAKHASSVPWRDMRRRSKTLSNLTPSIPLQCPTAQGFKFIGASHLNNGKKSIVSVTDKYGILRTIKTIVHC